MALKCTPAFCKWNYSFLITTFITEAMLYCTYWPYWWHLVASSRDIHFTPYITHKNLMQWDTMSMFCVPITSSGWPSPKWSHTTFIHRFLNHGFLNRRIGGDLARIMAITSELLVLEDWYLGKTFPIKLEMWGYKMVIIDISWNFYRAQSLGGVVQWS